MSAPNLPKVTVIVSTFNGERYIVEAVESVLNQSYQNLIFTIVDDGSTDQTVPLLKEMAKKDSRLRILENKVNRGTGYSYSILLENAEGEYVAAIGQDDRWEPDFLKVSIENLQKNPDAAVSFTSVQIIDSDSKLRNPQNSPFLFDFAATLTRDELVCMLLRYNFLCAAGAVFRTALIKDWHTLGENDQLQDWNTWQFLVLKGRFLFLPEKRMSYRIHGNNLSMSGSSLPLIQVELIHTRIAMISSQAFVDFVLNNNNPEHLFYQAMIGFAETMNVDDPSHYVFLFQALKKNESYFGGFKYFQAIMEMLSLFNGEISKTNTQNGAGGQLEASSAFWLGFEWRYLLVMASPSIANPVSRFIKMRKKGPIRVLKVLVKKGSLPPISFCIDFNAQSVDELLECRLNKKTGNGPNSAEDLFIQTQALSSPDFVKNVVESHNPDETFARSMATYARDMNVFDPAHYDSLLYALRVNEASFRNLPHFQAVMEMLFFYTGSILKSRRYFIRHPAEVSCNESFWKGFEWRYVVGRTLPRQGASPKLLKTIPFGPISVYKVLVRKGFLLKIGFSFDRRSQAVERLLEEYFTNRRLSLKQLLSKVLSSYGMGWVVTKLRGIKRRMLSL